MKSHFFPLLCSGETCSCLSAHGEVFFPSHKSYLSFQSFSFFKETFWSAISICFCNKWSSLKLCLLQERFWEKKMTLHTLKNPNLSNGMCRYHTMMLKWVLQIAERQNQQPPGLQGKSCLSED